MCLIGMMDDGEYEPQREWLGISRDAPLFTDSLRFVTYEGRRYAVMAYSDADARRQIREALFLSLVFLMVLGPVD
jgi:hypothetical protein